MQVLSEVNVSQSQGALYIPRPGRGVITLIVMNVVCWILYVIALRLELTPLTDALALTPKEFFWGSLWQPLTAMLIHSAQGTSHLMWNMVFLWIFGVDVEQAKGTATLWRSYFLAGLGGMAAVLLQGLVGLALGGSYESWWTTPGLGASGAVNGILGVWGGMYWYQTRNFLILGPMKGRTFFLLMAGLELLGMLSFQQGIGYAAHLGGMATGLAIGRGYLRPGALKAWRERRRMTRERRKIEERMRRFEVIQGGKDDGTNDDGEWIN